MPISPIETDFLVIGGGIAGLRAAISASQQGQVIILNKGLKGESSSEFAQGGIAAALSESSEDIQSHYQDTIDAGRGLCREEAVRILVEEGPRRVHELLDWGVAFDKVGDQFVLAREGAHRQNRILRARGDATGNEIVRTLQRTIAPNKSILTLNGQFTLKLILQKNTAGQDVCSGVWALDEVKGSVRYYRAKAVILATGGIGQVYSRTTNPPVATGDGLSMALEAGVALENMAFFQFHPTALCLAGAPSFLLSEAIRGEGGYLRNAEGKRFMDRYHPDAELAPRDLVSRAIVHEMEQSQKASVFLDLSHLNPAFTRKRFPSIYATCLRYGVDIARDPVPVSPSAHYMMGGIKTDLFGKTNIPGLLAVGEVASTGVHGANRLASNSLLEGLVFGARAGEVPASQEPSLPLQKGKLRQNSISNSETFDLEKEHSTLGTAAKSELLVQKELKEAMWRDVGIIRSETSLRRARESCRQLALSLKAPQVTRLAFETRNMLRVASAVIESALQRRESLGAHFREDFPEKPRKRPSSDRVQMTWETISHPLSGRRGRQKVETPDSVMKPF